MPSDDDLDAEPAARAARTMPSSSRATASLSREQRVQLARADDGAQRELRLAVEGLAVVLDRGDGLQRVGHLEGHDRVQAQRHLVGGHDLLAGDVHDLLAQVDVEDARRRATPFQNACGARGRASPRGGRP